MSDVPRLPAEVVDVPGRICCPQEPRQARCSCPADERIDALCPWGFAIQVLLRLYESAFSCGGSGKIALWTSWQVPRPVSYFAFCCGRLRRTRRLTGIHVFAVVAQLRGRVMADVARAH